MKCLYFIIGNIETIQISIKIQHFVLFLYLFFRVIFIDMENLYAQILLSPNCKNN